MAIAVKPVSKPIFTHFPPYFGNNTSDQRKITSKVLKKYGECCKTDLNADEQTFSPVSWQQYPRSKQNNLQSAKYRTANAVKPISKTKNEHFLKYFCNGTFDSLEITSKVLKKTANALKICFKPSE